MIRLLIQIHKWLALIVGVQILAWALGGLVMTAIPLSLVRGEHNIAAPDRSALPLDGVMAPGEAAQQAGLFAVTSVTLRLWLDRPVYEMSALRWPVLIDARTGALLSPISMEQAIAAAQADHVDARRRARPSVSQTRPGSRGATNRLGASPWPTVKARESMCPNARGG